jgi:glucose uptake protein GlcU
MIIIGFIAMTIISVGLAIEVIRDRARIAELEHKESDWL